VLRTRKHSKFGSFLTMVERLHSTYISFSKLKVNPACYDIVTTFIPDVTLPGRLMSQLSVIIFAVGLKAMFYRYP